MSKRPTILLIAVGGTISAAPDERGRNAPAKSATDILTSLPEAQDVADIRLADAQRMSSRAMTPAYMCSLAHEIRAGVAAGCDGVVVTHGTDTMEETAYALALQLDVDVPVVLTGAMRPAHEPGADGPANLLAALRVAVTPETTDLGPVVVMQDELYSARWVTKMYASRVAAFSSPGFGPVGCVIESRVRLQARSVEQDYLGAPDALNQRVELVWVAAGADGMLVEAASAVADGLVIAGTGGGHVPPQMAEAVCSAVEGGLPVVLASRCVGGSILERSYGGVGSETHLLEMGVHPAGSLSPIKARLRLLVALALAMDPAEAFPG